MRQKDLNMVKLISCLIKNKSLKMTGKDHNEPSIYSKYNIYKNEDGSYNSDNAPFDERTLRRYVSELCSNGIFQRDDNGFYSVNPDYFKLNFSQSAPEWQKLADTILDNGGTETYVMLRELLYNNKDSFMDDIKLKRYSGSVKEPVHILKNNREVISHINDAVGKKCHIRIEYKGKEHTILPVCYVISKDGTRTYLYYKHKRRNQIGTPMELQYINFLGEDRQAKEDIDMEVLRNQAREAWDIETGEKVNVKLLVRRDTSEKEVCDYIINFLEEKDFEKSLHGSGNYYICAGEVSGINGFKAWLRKYIDICIVQEPLILRNEMEESLRNKIKRYEEEINAG